VTFKYSTLNSSVIFFGIPTLLIIIGIFGGQIFLSSEIFGLFFSIVLIVGYLFAVKCFLHNYTPKIKKVIELN